MTKPIVLCILDGIGISKEKQNNIRSLPGLNFYSDLLRNYPGSELGASGEAVGLPKGTMGNSEVGHITMGAGRIVNQFLIRFKTQNWDKNKRLNDFTNKIKANNGIVHIVGMMSDGKVHSSIDDMLIITERILNSGLKVLVHFVADGRDTPPKSAKKYIEKIQRKFKKEFKAGNIAFATISGRFFAMDRNQNLDRTNLAFDAIANNNSDYVFDSIEAALTDAYSRGETDEFIKPSILNSNQKVGKKDGILLTNYRADRPRQIVRKLLRTKATILSFAQYGEGLNDIIPALMDDVLIKNTLGNILNENNKTQLRIAETEKYNHVTYFFDAEKNLEYKGLKKILISSPDVATFDMAPEMSAKEITDSLLPELSKFDVIILNFANPDMVGHTANKKACIKAMQCVDAQLKRIVPQVLALDGTMLITSDHGNIEKIWDKKTETPWTAHTTNKVNFSVISNKKHSVINGSLSDIAPTILKLLGIEKPIEMTGKSLIK